MPERNRAYLLTDARRDYHAAHCAPLRPPADAEPADMPQTAPEPPQTAEGPSPRGDDHPRPETAPWDALVDAGPERVSVAELETAYGMGRSWVYYRSKRTPRQAAVQVRRGYWRAARPSDGPSGDGRPPASPRPGPALRRGADPADPRGALIRVPGMAASRDMQPRPAIPAIRRPGQQPHAPRRALAVAFGCGRRHQRVTGRAVPQPLRHSHRPPVSAEDGPPAVHEVPECRLAAQNVLERVPGPRPTLYGTAVQLGAPVAGDRIPSRVRRTASVPIVILPVSSARIRRATSRIISAPTGLSAT